MKAQGGKISILCIEDEPVVADFIASLLDADTYSFSNIADGKAALDHLLSGAGQPDLILLDYILPSMNGIEILKALKTYHRKFPIIFLTSDKSLDTAIAAMKEGANEFLTKSSNLKAELNIKVERVYQEYKKNKEYERQLLLKAEEMECFFAIVTDLLCIVESDTGKFTQLNNVWEETLGFTTEELINTPFMDLVHPDDVAPTVSVLQELKKSRRISRFVNRYRCRDKSYKSLEWNFITNNSGLSYFSGRHIAGHVPGQ